ncbi:MAG: cytochrome c biogenesis protein CcsA [Acidobacteriota bacterium]|nr:MAG: cytochrome c biogenesis protein CcsA [Acidobacteriota bacterium]
MSEVIKSINQTIGGTGTSEMGWRGFSIVSYLPAILPLIGAALMVTARIKLGEGAVPADGTLVVLALLCYIISSASLMTNFWAPIRFLQRLGLLMASVGFFFNLSGWLVRWVAAGDRENWIRMTNQITGEYHFWWFFSYIPFANLYDLSVAFAFGAAFATLLISHRENTRFVGALSLPLIALILLLAIFIGNSFINLPPVLDSYWRPIHVGVASLSYGVALVSFALAVVYLLKDGVRSEQMALVVAGSIIVMYAFVWLMGGIKAFNPFAMSYALNPAIEHSQGVTNIGARIPLPGVGIWMTLSFLLIFGTAVAFLLKLYRNNDGAGRWGHWMMRASLVTQAIGIGLIFYQIKSLTNIGGLIGQDQYYNVGKQLMGKEATGQTVDTIVNTGANWLQMNASRMILDVRSNPVEIAAVISLFVVTLFLVLFGIRTERIRESLPPLEKIDSLIYKTVGVAFAGLAILLVTGAVWANESWGRYWGWDAKETGALVAWLAYAGYLHTRIAHGWSGRRSAYFALIGFLLVIFTYLGVSYILPGLHSYA